MTDLPPTSDDIAAVLAALADNAAEDGCYGFQDACLLIGEALAALPAEGLTAELQALLAGLPQVYKDYRLGDRLSIAGIFDILQHPVLQVILADDELLLLAEQLNTDLTALSDGIEIIADAPDEPALADTPEKVVISPNPVLSKASLELVALLDTQARYISSLIDALPLGQTDALAADLENIGEELERYISAANMAGFTGLALVCEQVLANIERFHANIGVFSAEHQVLLQSWISETIAYLAAVSDSQAGLPLLAILGADSWLLPVTLEDAGLIMAHFKATDANLHEPEPEIRKQTATLNDIDLTLPEDVNPELLDILLHELPLQIQEFSSAIQRLQTGGSIADLEIAQRVAHTVKGAANTVGIKGIAELTHQLEDILLAFASAQQLPGYALLSVLMDAADCLAVMGESLTGFSPPPEDALLVLQSVLDWANQIEQVGVAALLEPNNQAGSMPPEPALPNTDEPIAASSSVRVASAQLDDLFKLADENVILNSQANERLRRIRAQLRAMEAQIELLRQLGDELEQLVDLKDLTGQASGKGQADFDALEMDQYNELHTASRRMVEAAFDAREISKDASKELEAMNEVLEDQQRIGNETQAVMMQTRLLPVSSIAQRLQRSLRQTCRLTQKQCDLVLTGDHLMVNGDTLNSLLDPLMHLLRNAVDHGIETAEQRLAAGKNPHGTLALHFELDGNHIRVRVQDDGRGLDFAAIRDTAIRRGLLDSGQNLSDKDLARYILRPNFSTRTVATQTSGRGVGMDAVHYQVVGLGGSLALDSVPGLGLSVDLRVPLPMSRVHALLTQVGTYKVAIANKGVTQILFAGAATILDDDQGQFVLLADERYEAVALSRLLRIPERRKRELYYRTVLLVQHDEQTTAVLIDAITDSLDIVIKSLGQYVNKIPGFAGAAIMGDGTVAAVVDLPELLRRQYADAVTYTELAEEWLPETRLPTVLLVDDSLSQRRALEQLLQDAGFAVRTARDGIEATEQLADFKPDIVLTDLEMPRMNGIELTAHIRTRENLKTLPVIMITSRTTQAHRQLALEAGIDFYLVKPVQEDDLLGKIQGLLAVATP